MDTPQSLAGLHVRRLTTISLRREKVEKSMDYWIFSISSGELEKSSAAHVLARAYREAWRVKKLTEPEGAHHFNPLDLVICYGGYSPPRIAMSEDDVQPAPRLQHPICGDSGDDNE